MRLPATTDSGHGRYGVRALDDARDDTLNDALDDLLGGRMNGTRPVRESARVLWAHKQLLAMPGIAGVVVAAAIGLLVALEVALWPQLGGSAGNIALAVAGVALVTLICTFFNAALILAADDALSGRPVTVGRSYARAARRFPAIAAWAATGILVWLAGALLERVPVVGWVLEKALGIAWGFATYLVLPAMMIDGLGLRDALRNSGRSFGRDGGRIVRGSLWIALPALLAWLAALGLLILGFRSNDTALMILAAVGAGLLAAVATAVSASLSGVFRTRLYREARA
ncbi:DUF6159 family protein [Kitasatospora sp. NPDC093558]|uniref:DUF6159 family protein n=1 Tax=Kitasatospora sp. NPDC093558 TaxID=3155201 RepID=UPI003425A6A8